MGQMLSKVRAKRLTSLKPSGSSGLSQERSSERSLPTGFKWQDGRSPRRDANAAYPFPSNSDEVMRLNAQHFLVRYLLEGNHRAPVQEELKTGIKVLDAGCGSGIWSIEMAKLYPNSDFTGTDIANVFTSSISNAPSNCHFQIADTLKGLPFENDAFDYVFQRFQVPCFRVDEWPNVLRELFRVTKPGGWIELVDSQGVCFSTGPNTDKWFELLFAMLRARDIDIRWSSNFPGAFKELGLTNITADYRSMPLGWGPPEIAEPSYTNFVKIFTAFKPQMTATLGISEDEYDQKTKEAENEFRLHKTYWNIDYVYGRKPMA